MSEFTRPRHVLVMRVLSMLNAAFLEDAHCYFGGCTAPNAGYSGSAEVGIE